MPYTADYVQDKLRKELDATHVTVKDLSDGCGAKFDVLVVSPRFSGVSLLNRQRLVNEVLKEEMSDIHALTQKTMTPEQWEASQQKAVTASAPGKVILFGEHSVVYGRTAVAAALQRRTTVTLKAQQSGTLTVTMPAVDLRLKEFLLPANEDQITGLTLSKDSPLNLSVLIEEACPELLSRLAWWDEIAKDVKTPSARQAILVLGFLHSAIMPSERFFEGLHVEVNSMLTLGAGTGSSAAYSVALAAALGRFALDHDPGINEVERLAWKAEHLVHGLPSGLDTAISAYGGLVRFRARKVQTEPLPKFPFLVMLVDSGVERETRQMLYRAKDRLVGIGDHAAQALLDAMDQVAITALDVLQQEQGFTRLEHLVRSAQGLLSALGVSHSVLDAICTTADSHGFAAKLTGAGGGGNAFVILPNSTIDLGNLQNKLCENHGCHSAHLETLFGPGLQYS